MSYSQGHAQSAKKGGSMGMIAILGLLGLAGAGAAIYMKTRKPKTGGMPSLAGVAKSPGCGCGH